MAYGPYPWAYPHKPNTSVPIAGQTEATYLNWKKTQQFDNVGYFLQTYVVSGGIVTKNATRNDQIDIVSTVFVLGESLQNRDAAPGIGLTNPSSTYFVDLYQGDYWVDTNHPTGTAGQDYITLATVTTDANGLVDTITDTRNPVGGFRLDPSYPFSGYVQNPATENLDMASNKITNLAAPTAANDAARKTDVDTANANSAKTNISNTFTSDQTFQGAIGAQGSIEVGKPTAAGAAYVDFHSSGIDVDFDSRILASGGGGAGGDGVLDVYASLFRRNSNPIFDSGNSPISKTDNGYQKLANGFLIQWGTAVLSANETKTITFPLAFSANPQVVGSTMDFPANVAIGDNGYSATQFNAINSSAGAARFRWIAIGYVS